MPWVIVNVLKGHSDDKKVKLHKSVSKAISESLEIPLDWVKIQIVEMEHKDHSIGGIPLDKMS